jgi:hypothetical protein
MKACRKNPVPSYIRLGAAAERLFQISLAQLVERQARGILP